jgi:hypothetical protein
MSRNKLAGIIVACTIAIIVTILITHPPNGKNGNATNESRPAHFVISDLRIDPAEISADEKTTISVRVTNDGDLPGDYQIVFKIDNATVKIVDGHLANGGAENITWATAVGYSPGSHSVDVNGLVSGTFTVEATHNLVPINARIDYFAIGDAMGEDDYGGDPLYGQIQLIIVVSDGKNEPQTCYIPQETPRGLAGYTIPDYSEIQEDQRVYHVDSAGDYLKVSILAYDLDSKDNLVTAAKVLELLGTLVGVPETKVFEALVSLLPVEDDLVGGCEEVWYSDEDYGIGQHELSCLDKFADANLFVGLSIWSDEEPSLLPVPPTLPGVAENQTSKYHMSPNIVTGSYVQYRRVLQAGEKITGSLQLTGYYPYSDADPTCCFWIYDPDGNEVYRWCEDFKSNGLHHDFSYTANRDGVYVIKVGHGSLYARDLDMVISPYGWQ